jgi:hypothetical protein
MDDERFYAALRQICRKYNIIVKRKPQNGYYDEEVFSFIRNNRKPKYLLEVSMWQFQIEYIFYQDNQGGCVKRSKNKHSFLAFLRSFVSKNYRSF